jgi:hypothetical protein
MVGEAGARKHDHTEHEILWGANRLKQILR